MGSNVGWDGPLTPVILMRCVACGVEFCQWQPRGQWSALGVLLGFGLLAVDPIPYLPCGACGQMRVKQVGDIELAPLFTRRG